MKKVISLICLVVMALTLTGCTTENKIDFELVAGSMVSKENMTEEEKKMHDAKVIQYAVYQTKNIIAKGLNDDNSRRIGDIALTVKANLFSKENPRDWLYTYYHFFSFYENIGKLIDSETRHSPLGGDLVATRWRCLSTNIDEMEEAVNKYVGATIAERANLDIEVKKQITPILGTLNSNNLVTIYRNANHDHEYMFGTQPEPTRESILFAKDALQKMLKIAPMGELSTVTMANIYVNDMIGTLSTMLEDYDATRYDPTYKTMNQWGVTHARLGGSWAGYQDLLNKLKKLYVEEEKETTEVQDKEVVMSLPLPHEDEKYVLKVYVDGVLNEDLTQEINPKEETKKITFNGKEHDEQIIKFEINNNPYKVFGIDFETGEVLEIE